MTQVKVSEDDLIEYDGITYRIKSYSEVPWIGGQYMGRFVFGDRYALPVRE
jgi:hypothetical protein